MGSFKINKLYLYQYVKELLEWSKKLTLIVIFAGWPKSRDYAVSLHSVAWPWRSWNNWKTCSICENGSQSYWRSWTE